MKKPFEIAKQPSKSDQPQKDMSKEAIEATELDIQARQLPNAGWPECFERIGDGRVLHLCNAIHVFEGIGEDGQLYLRRVWGLSSVEHPPEDFSSHDWEPMFQPDDLLSSLDDIRTHLNRLVEDQSLRRTGSNRSILSPFIRCETVFSNSLLKNFGSVQPMQSALASQHQFA